MAQFGCVQPGKTSAQIGRLDGARPGPTRSEFHLAVQYL